MKYYLLQQEIVANMLRKKLILYIVSYVIEHWFNKSHFHIYIISW